MAERGAVSKSPATQLDKTLVNMSVWPAKDTRLFTDILL